MTPKEKLESIIADGEARVASGINAISREFQIRRDMVAKPSAIDFDVTDDVNVIVNSEQLSLTGHSRSQVFAKSGIPEKFASRLIEYGERELLRETLRKMLDHTSSDGIMIRAVDSTIKGWLSPSYKRYDASPIFETFVERSVKAGFLPYRGYVTDSRAHLSFLDNNIVELGPSLDPVVFGLSITTSDYGAAALELELNVLRILCTNLAVGMDVLRKVHLGHRFTIDAEYQLLSDATIALDAKTVASGMGDVIEKSRGIMAKFTDHINKELSDPDKATKGVGTAFAMIQKQLGKKQTDLVKTLYEGEQPLEMLPVEKNTWRLSNALSFLAKSKKGDDSLSMEKLAFDVLTA